MWAVGRSGRLDRETFDTLSDPDILRAALAIGFVELPIGSAVAATIAGLPLLHRDPFDRLLVAQAIAEPAILYTADGRLPGYSELVRRIPTR